MNNQQHDIARRLGPKLDRIYSPRTPEPIAFIETTHGGKPGRYPVYGYLFEERGEPGMPAGVFCIIERHILTADGETFVDLNQLDREYINTGCCDIIPVDKWRDMQRFVNELNALERIARAYVALHEVRQDQRITAALLAA